MASICGCWSVDSLIGEHTFNFEVPQTVSNSNGHRNEGNNVDDGLKSSHAKAEQLADRLYAFDTDASTALDAQPLLQYMNCVSEPKPAALPENAAHYLKSLKFDVSDDIFDEGSSAVWMKSIWEGAEKVNFGYLLKLHATYYFHPAQRLAYIVVRPSVPSFLHFFVEFTSHITVVASSLSSSSRASSSSSSSSSSESKSLKENSVGDVVRVREVVKMNGRRVLLKSSLQEGLNAHKKMFETWWKRALQQS